MPANQATNLHFRVQNISRRTGKRALASAAYRSGTRLRTNISVVARAAYRSGESLHDTRADTTYDFRRKEKVEYTGIYAHSSRPDWALHRGDLWNTVELVEKRKDARLAKDLTVALPRELTLQQQIALLEAFVEQEFVSKGYVVDLAIHDKNASDGGSNPHAHIMIPTRTITEKGFASIKDRDLDTPETLKQWRDNYEALCNRFLADSGSDQRVSLSSYSKRGIDQIPGKHMGHEAWNLEKRGIETTGGNINRSIRHYNNLRDMLKSQGLDIVPVPDSDSPPKAKRERGLAEIARPEASDSDSDGQAGRNRQVVKALAQSLATPVVKARFSAIRQLNRFRQWWNHREQTREAEVQRNEDVFERHESGRLAGSARLLRLDKDDEHER